MSEFSFFTKNIYGFSGFNSENETFDLPIQGYVSDIRTGIQGMKSKIILSPSTSIDITVAKADGSSYKVTLTKNGTGATGTTNGNPNALSTDGSSSAAYGADGTDGTLALVIDPSGRANWKTEASGQNTVITSKTTNCFATYYPATGVVSELQCGK